MLKDGTECLPAKLELLGKDRCLVTVMEGKYHQVKRMFEKVGKTVKYLKRTAMNRLPLDEGLAEGEVRELTDDELELLTYGTK